MFVESINLHFNYAIFEVHLFQKDLFHIGQKITPEPLMMHLSYTFLKILKTAFRKNNQFLELHKQSTKYSIINETFMTDIYILILKYHA